MGAIIVNKKSFDQYFPREAHIKSIMQPLVMTKVLGQYNITCPV